MSPGLGNPYRRAYERPLGLWQAVVGLASVDICKVFYEPAGLTLA